MWHYSSVSCRRHAGVETAGEGQSREWCSCCQHRFLARHNRRGRAVTKSVRGIWPCLCVHCIYARTPCVFATSLAISCVHEVGIHARAEPCRSASHDVMQHDQTVQHDEYSFMAVPLSPFFVTASHCSTKFIVRLAPTAWGHHLLPPFIHGHLCGITYLGLVCSPNLPLQGTSSIRDHTSYVGRTATTVTAVTLCCHHASGLWRPSRAGTLRSQKGLT
jgi:hypothetical protein